MDLTVKIQWVLLIIISSVTIGESQAKRSIDFYKAPKKYTEVVLGGPIGYVSIGVGRQYPIKNLNGSFRPSVTFIGGAYYASDDTPPYGIAINADILMMAKPQKNSIDASFGLGVSVLNFSEDRDLPLIWPRFNLQYRFQREYSFTRIGLGYPELINISFGF